MQGGGVDIYLCCPIISSMGGENNGAILVSIQKRKVKSCNGLHTKYTYNVSKWDIGSYDLIGMQNYHLLSILPRFPNISLAFSAHELSINGPFCQVMCLHQTFPFGFF